MGTFIYCQSCGMPMKKDPQKGGTNSDGSKNHMYCSYCYNNGAFRQPNATLDEMKDMAKNELKKMGFPNFIVSWFKTGIPNLKRWK